MRPPDMRQRLPPALEDLHKELTHFLTEQAHHDEEEP